MPRRLRRGRARPADLSGATLRVAREVRTDPARLDSNTPEFLRLVDSGPLLDLMRAHGSAPRLLRARLVGIWSRFPYLHNGSGAEPRRAARITRAAPRAFSLAAAGEERRFDRARWAHAARGGHADARKLIERGHRGARDVYFTGRVGTRARGIRSGRSSRPRESVELIEYLKTL